MTTGGTRVSAARGETLANEIAGKTVENAEGLGNGVTLEKDADINAALQQTAGIAAIKEGEAIAAKTLKKGGNRLNLR